MGYSTQAEHVKSARKDHEPCDWCLQKIKKGDSYVRWRWYDSGDASTVRVHPECYQALKEMQKSEGWDFEFYPGNNPRGGFCGWCGECEHCKAHKAA